MLDELQRDSDEDVSGRNEDVELPFQEQWHFGSFDVKYRNTESREEVKAALDALEKEALLLNLIPIAFDDDLETNVQVTKMLIDNKLLLIIFWDFIIIYFRFFGKQKVCIVVITVNSKDWISFLWKTQLYRWRTARLSLISSNIASTYCFHFQKIQSNQ